MEIKDNYQFNVNINQRAIIEFFKTKNINLGRLKELKGEHYFILSFVVDKYLNTNLISKVFKGEKYTYMGNSLFFDNLPLMFVKMANSEEDKKKEYEALKRNLQNYLERLIALGFIYREIENKKTRFLRADSVLLDKCNKFKNNTPLEIISQYWNNDLKIIEKEYTQFLPYGRYPNLEKSFFNNEHYDQYMNDHYVFDKENILVRFRLYLDECVKDPYYKIKAK